MASPRTPATTARARSVLLAEDASSSVKDSGGGPGAADVPLDGAVDADDDEFDGDKEDVPTSVPVPESVVVGEAAVVKDDEDDVVVAVVGVAVVAVVVVEATELLAVFFVLTSSMHMGPVVSVVVI